MKCLLLSLLLQTLTVLAASPAAWKSRAIYQVFTDRFAQTDGSTSASCDPSAESYCGGTWLGIANKLDYIQGMGFDAIWISPVTKQLDTKAAYHGYWQNDLYSVNEHFGSELDLIALVLAAHLRGMYVMADVVTNHFANYQNDVDDYWVDFVPFSDSKYFHSPCNINDYNNQTEVEVCWLGYNTTYELSDLDTTRQDVKDIYSLWIKDLVAKYGFDGIRIDSVEFVQPDFWKPFNDAAGVYAVGEVSDGRVDYVCPYQDDLDGVLNYPLSFAATSAFSSTSSNMSSLVDTIAMTKQDCRDTTTMAPFLENHDQARFPSLTSDIALDKTAIAFTTLFDGIPIIYQGQEQHFNGGRDPADREALWTSGYNTDSDLYKYIKGLITLRKHAISVDSGYLDYQAFPIYSDAQNIAIRKGNSDALVLSVLSNKGHQGNAYNLSIPTTGFSGNSSVTEIITCNKYTVDGNGGLSVPMSEGAPRIFYPTKKLAGCGLCDV